jgi:predicted short-subunit dehydrogenase-like oxidoreductase (DUF2520 family)
VRPRAVGTAATTVSIVGAGRLGTALARALAARGYKIEAVVARTLRHAGRAAEIVGTRPLALASTDLHQLPPSDILFVTTPDDLIAATAAGLAATFEGRAQTRGKRRARTALHTSGALTSEVLHALRAAGFSIGSMHPLVSVSDPVQGAASLGSAFFCLEGSRGAVGVARRVVRALGASSFSIAARDKALYHAAAVMSSGHMTALYDVALEMLGRCGLTRGRARAVLLPLLKSTLENLYTSDPARALTGTFARADTATVRRHLKALSAPGMAEALAAYTLLGRHSLRLAKSAGVSGKALKEIESALAKAEKV